MTTRTMIDGITFKDAPYKRGKPDPLLWRNEPTKLIAGLTCPHCGCRGSLYVCGERPPLKGEIKRRREYGCYVCGQTTVNPVRSEGA